MNSLQRLHDTKKVVMTFHTSESKHLFQTVMHTHDTLMYQCFIMRTLDKEYGLSVVYPETPEVCKHLEAIRYCPLQKCIRILAEEMSYFWLSKFGEDAVYVYTVGQLIHVTNFPPYIDWIERT